MFLRRLTLINIRSIETIDLCFDNGHRKIRQWTMILGENGVGKSTILRALALALVGGEGLQDLLMDPSDWVRKGSDQGIIRIEIITPEGTYEEIELSFSPDYNRRTMLSKNAAALDHLENAQKQASHHYLTIGYGVSRRLSLAGVSSLKKSDSFINPRVQGLATLFDPNATLYPLDTWAMDLHYRRGKKGLGLINKTFKNLLKDVEFLEIDREKRELLFDTPDGVISLQNLSDGYQNVVGWWGDLLFRITNILENLKDPLSAKGLLLVDEVDLHLHPVWQRQLRDFLTQRLPNFEIVTTTHSPMTAQQCGPGELFFLQRFQEKGHPILTQYEGDPRYLKIQQLIASPIFGLDTVASKHVEDLRKSYSDLKDSKVSEPIKNKRSQQIKAELSQVADASILSERERKQQELLKKINNALKK